MEILLEKLSSEGQPFECAFTFDVEGTIYNVEKCKGIVKPEDGQYSLAFDIDVTFTDRCDRCLKRFDEKYVGSVQLVLGIELEETDKEVTPAEEVELTESDMSIYMMPDGILDVKDIVTQETIILRPYKRLCSDDCSGICQGCGVDLNAEKCACEKETDVRWQALKKYMTNQKQEI